MGVIYIINRREIIPLAQNSQPIQITIIKINQKPRPNQKPTEINQTKKSNHTDQPEPKQPTFRTTKRKKPPEP
jgi:hypothetical protein